MRMGKEEILKKNSFLQYLKRIRPSKPVFTLSDLMLGKVCSFSAIVRVFFGCWYP